MHLYFATFPAGSYDIISRRLKKFTLAELRIVQHDESSLSFFSKLPIESLVELRFFTNVFIVLEDGIPLPRGVLKGEFFTLHGLRNGQPHTIKKQEEIKRRIARLLTLRPGNHLGSNSFYLIERKSTKPFLALRLPRAKFKRRKLIAGELRPELSHILCLAAGLRAKHRLIDPFAGYGAIPREAIEGFGCREVIAVDKLPRPSALLPSVVWHQSDSLKLDFIAGNTIDRVVTDPPWGSYSTFSNLANFYQRFGNELARILRNDGISVVLSGYEDAEQAILKNRELRLLTKWPILVSGKKATIYKIQKI